MLKIAARQSHRLVTRASCPHTFAARMAALRLDSITLITTAFVLIALSAGCSQTTTTGGVANALAQSLPTGTVQQNGQTVTAVQNATGAPTVTNILNAVNTANHTTTPANSGVTNALTPSNIMAAVNAANTANATKNNANAYQMGPGPNFGMAPNFGPTMPLGPSLTTVGVPGQ